DRDRRVGEDRRAVRQPRGEIARRPVAMAERRRHFVLREGVLETELVQRPLVQDRRMTDDGRLTRDGEVEAGARRGAAAGRDDRTIFVFSTPPEEHALLARQLMIDFQVVGPAVLRALERSFVDRPQTARVDREELIFVGALVGEEEMRLVLDDRSADGAAVLIAAVVRLRRLKKLLGGR